MPMPGMLVEIDGIIQCIANCVIILGKIEVATHEAVKDAGNILEENMKKLAPVYTSALKESITSQWVDPNTIEVGPHVDYAVYMEYGAAPHTPPPGALAQWAEDKGMDESEIVSKIEEFGVDAQPFIEPAIEMSKPAIEAKMGEISAIINL